MRQFEDQALAIPAPPAPGGRPLRLAFVSHCLNPGDQSASRIGGAERAAAELLAAHQGLDEVVVTPIIERAASNRLRFAGFAGSGLMRLSRLARAGAIDAVLFSGMPTAWMGLLLAKGLKRGGVVSAAICHGHDVTMDFAPYQTLVRRVFGALDAVLPVSVATGAHCLARGLDPGRMHVTPNGTDFARFPPAPADGERRAILRAAFPGASAGLGEGGFVLCTVGRQAPRKGHAWFVREVMPRLPGEVQLWLGGDGAEAAAIEAAAREAGVSGRVKRLGVLPERQLVALYRGADLFVMPNVPLPGDIEGFGLVMLEANLNGLPVLASRLEGLVDVVAEGVNGRLVQPLDAEAFAGAVQALRRDAAQRRRLGRQAVTHARGFGWTSVAERQVRILRAAAAA